MGRGVFRDVEVSTLRKYTPRHPSGKSGAFALDKDHVHIGKGLIYCKEYQDSEAPLTTHSRVKCALCKRVLSGVNPPMFTAEKLRSAGRHLIEGGIPGRAARELITKAMTYGLSRLPAREREMLEYSLARSKNPVVHRHNGRSPVHIYGQTEKIFMRKTRGPYKGQRFVHDFKGGVEQVGFPRGTVIQSPDGKSFKLTTRSVMLTGKKDLWRNFQA